MLDLTDSLILQHLPVTLFCRLLNRDRPEKDRSLGATGSIGESTLQVIRKHSDRLQLIGVSAHSNSQKLADISNEFKVPHAYLPETVQKLRTGHPIAL